MINVPFRYAKSELFVRCSAASGVAEHRCLSLAPRPIDRGDV